MNIEQNAFAGASDPRGPAGLRWEMSNSVVDAVAAARQWLGKADASVTYWRAPPIGYARVKLSEKEMARLEAEAQAKIAKEAAAAAAGGGGGEGQPCKYTLEKQRKAELAAQQQQGQQQQGGAA